MRRGVPGKGRDAMGATRTTPFGDLLRRHRMAVGLSQEALAERAGLSTDAIRALERGRRVAPRPDPLTMLASVLELTDAARAELITAAMGAPALHATPARDTTARFPALPLPA